MSKYKVIRLFTDLQDDGYKYDAGDIYPREGLTVSQKRINELSTGNNRQHVALITKIDEPVEKSDVDDVESEKPRTRTYKKRKYKNNDN